MDTIYVYAAFDFGTYENKLKVLKELEFGLEDQATSESSIFIIDGEEIFGYYDDLLELTKHTRLGHLRIDNDADGTFTLWNNGRWIRGETAEYVTNFLDTQIDKDTFLLSQYQWEDKYPEKDFYAYFDDACMEAVSNAENCFVSLRYAEKYLDNKMLARVIVQEQRFPIQVHGTGATLAHVVL